jgi:hypothetical protein
LAVGTLNDDDDSAAASCSRRSSFSSADSLAWVVDSARLASAAAARDSEAASCSRRSSFSSADSLAWVAVAARLASAVAARRSSSNFDREAGDGFKRRLTKASAGDSADVASSCSRRSSLSMLS